MQLRVRIKTRYGKGLWCPWSPVVDWDKAVRSLGLSREEAEAIGGLLRDQGRAWLHLHVPVEAEVKLKRVW